MGLLALLNKIEFMIYKTGGVKMTKVSLKVLVAGLVTSCSIEEPNDSGMLVDSSFV